MDVYALLIAVGLSIITLTLLSNLVFFPRLRAANPAGEPLVSILIPARNEAGNIAETIRLVLAQDYLNTEIILLDDHSNDGTAAIAQDAANGDPRFSILAGVDLPAGWLGKNWACQQLSQAASGEFLLFVDADVRLAAKAVSALLAGMEQHRTDLLTIWPTQITQSWGERLVIPTMSFAILAYLPILPVHHTPLPMFAAANGQCLMFRRSAYDGAGGHASVRDDVVEDVAFARRIKKLRYRLRMADGNALVCCRMYPNWAGVRDGFSKNLLAGHGGSVSFLLASTVFHWSLFVVPWVWWLVGGGTVALGLGLWGVGLRALSAVFSRQRVVDALAMPFSVLLMTIIAAQSVRWKWQKTGEWKGRKLA